jgi:uridine kinase
MTPEQVAACLLPGMRVGIDGVTAAGKTTFADAVGALVGAPAVRLSIDEFHNPPEIRHARGEGPDSYYEDTFDVGRFRGAVEAVPRDRLLIADGIFILKPELRDLWDLTIWLEIDRQVALERALARDGEALRERYVGRYLPGETRYLEEVRPQELADLVVHTA